MTKEMPTARPRRIFSCWVSCEQVVQEMNQVAKEAYQVSQKHNQEAMGPIQMIKGL